MLHTLNNSYCDKNHGDVIINVLSRVKISFCLHVWNGISVYQLSKNLADMETDRVFLHTQLPLHNLVLTCSILVIP